ncbi:MAG: hypothetical protein [Podoviridae sp. ctrTa16]|nr:MAG: hypothetical protein [Podoviridae sp. ctrTa16]
MNESEIKQVKAVIIFIIAFFVAMKIVNMIADKYSL